MRTSKPFTRTFALIFAVFMALAFFAGMRTSSLRLSSTVAARALPPSRLRHFASTHTARGATSFSPIMRLQNTYKLQKCRGSTVVSSAAPVTAAAGESSPRFSMWSFNLRSDFNAEKDGKDCWAERKEGVAGLLNSYEPDIIATQELIAQQVAYLGDHLPLYEYEGCCRLGSDEDEYCAIFYKKDKFNVVDGDTMWLSETPDEAGSIGWDAMYPRIATWAVLEVKENPGNYVTVISTHFDHQGVEARKNSAKYLKELISDLQKKFPTSPVALAGDFNSIKIENEVYKTLTTGDGALLDAWGASESIEDNGWKRSTMHKFQGVKFDGCMGDGTVELCTVEEEGESSPKASDGMEHIDWILLRNAASGTGSLKAVKSEVFTDTLPSGRYPSDHFPVGTDLMLT